MWGFLRKKRWGHTYLGELLSELQENLSCDQKEKSYGLAIKVHGLGESSCSTRQRQKLCQSKVVSISGSGYHSSRSPNVPAMKQKPLDTLWSDLSFGTSHTPNFLRRVTVDTELVQHLHRVSSCFVDSEQHLNPELIRSSYIVYNSGSPLRLLAKKISEYTFFEKYVSKVNPYPGTWVRQVDTTFDSTRWIFSRKTRWEQPFPHVTETGLVVLEIFTSFPTLLT